ncbi:MAG TPA: hypothetical protein VHX60_06295 [Acidobacteriaceae bacterium]|jgi:hypothetical protein|nr:hypothetical protein [Acidobacteriaceae bacterium]
MPGIFLLAIACGSCSGQTQDVVCDQGNGKFETEFATGVTVRVGPALHAGFAARQCTATLTWNHDQIVAVPPTAQIDIDVLGADLGFGFPVAAFQVRDASDGWQSTYFIYSLEKNPHQVGTITGGDLYRASDADFTRNVAIWTTDAAAVNGFDDLTYADIDATPTVVLRYEHGKLTDVSANYLPHYDRQIAQVRAHLDAASLAAFRRSDGRLALGSVPGAELVTLRKTKVKVLEIVWGYLYSGRTDQAWAELSTDWPPADLERAKAAILAARARGLASRVVAAEKKPSPSLWHRHPYIYATDASSNARSGNAAPATVGIGPGAMPMSNGDDDVMTLTQADTPPQYFLMRGPPPSATRAAYADTEEKMTLVIDEAGKVWSAKMESPADDPELVADAKDWKFVPALRHGKAVACTYRMKVSPFQ